MTHLRYGVVAVAVVVVRGAVEFHASSAGQTATDRIAVHKIPDSVAFPP